MYTYIIKNKIIVKNTKTSIHNILILIIFVQAYWKHWCNHYVQMERLIDQKGLVY